MCVHDFERQKRVSKASLMCHRCKAIIIAGESYMETTKENLCLGCSPIDKMNEAPNNLIAWAVVAFVFGCAVLWVLS